MTIHTQNNKKPKKTKKKEVAGGKKKRNKGKEKKMGEEQKEGWEGFRGRGAWVTRRVGPHTNDAKLTRIISGFDHLQKDKPRKQRHSQCEAR